MKAVRVPRLNSPSITLAPPYKYMIAEATIGKITRTMWVPCTVKLCHKDSLSNSVAPSSKRFKSRRLSYPKELSSMKPLMLSLSKAKATKKLKRSKQLSRNLLVSLAQVHT